MAHAAATAAVNAKAAAALVKVLRQKNNENTAKFFAAGIAGIILISWILHWTRVAFKHHEVKVGQEVGVLKSPVAISRYHHSHCLDKHPLIA
jgi:cyanate permease